MTGTFSLKKEKHMDRTDLETVISILQDKEFVDLTHSFDESIPRWSGYEHMESHDIYTYEKDGFRATRFSIVGQYGTHFDPPAHFIPGEKTIDQIPVKELILPGFCIDVEAKVEKNPDYQLLVRDIAAFENEHGAISPQSMVIARTGWGKRWPHIDKFQNRDEQGKLHYPGWHLDSLRYLFEERQVRAIGHETPDTDAVFTGVFDCQRYVHSTGRWQVELLANVHRLPPRGFIVVIGVPKPKNGSGFPARAFAILP
jgi:kynurenine formamidase